MIYNASYMYGLWFMIECLQVFDDRHLSENKHFNAARSRVVTSIRSCSTSATAFYLPLFHLTSLRVCAGAAQFHFVLVEHMRSLGDHRLQFLSLITRLYSRHRRAYILRGGNAATPPPSPPPLLIFLISKSLHKSLV
jgi:hypothetical protein